jgi:hypothetical protein
LATINELVTRYKDGQLDFDALLAKVPTLDWGKRHVEADGEIWWDGDSTVGDVDALWYENTLTDEERDAILKLIP